MANDPHRDQRLEASRLPSGPSSRIVTFKGGGGLLAFKARQGRSLSLVDATISGRGHGTTVDYSDGRRCEHTEGLFHDCAYVDFRNSKIPEALRLALAAGHREGHSEASNFTDALNMLCGTPSWRS